MTLADTLREYLADCASGPDRPTPGAVCAPLAREAERLLDRVRFDRDQYIRHPILLWEDWEVMLISWEAGQVTPIHDHRGIMGGMAILSGTIVEERFTTPDGRPALSDSRSRPSGDLSETGPTVLHRLLPKSRAVSFHVYRPPLRTMGIWTPEGFSGIRNSVFDVGEEVLARASGG
jgi:predicted metal-dependent enzyme (double-stranded beta helix superfamily)